MLLSIHEDVIGMLLTEQAKRLWFILELLPSKRSKLAVDVAYVLRSQEAVPVSFCSLDLGEAVLVMLLEYLGANPLLEVRRCSIWAWRSHTLILAYPFRYRRYLQWYVDEQTCSLSKV